MNTFFVYILYSEKLNRFYIGQTYNLEERLRKHRSSTKHFTGKAKDWVLKYTESYSTRKEAIAREREIKKKKSRKYIEYLINNSKTD